MEKEIHVHKNTPKKTVLFKLGVVLLMLYPILWVLVAIVPFISLPLAIKATVITTLIVVGEIIFLIGVALVGKEVVTKYKSKLNPKNWRRKA